MDWEEIAKLFEIDPGVMIEAAEKETARLKAEGKRKKVYPEDILIYEICETYPEWSRMKILVPKICSFGKAEFAYLLELGRSPLARMLLFKERADCKDKGAALTLEEFLYGNPLLLEDQGTIIQKVGFVWYWIDREEGDEGVAIESLMIIGYSKEEAEEIVKKVKENAEKAGITVTEKKEPTKEEILADIKKRMKEHN